MGSVLARGGQHIKALLAGGSQRISVERQWAEHLVFSLHITLGYFWECKRISFYVYSGHGDPLRRSRSRHSNGKCRFSFLLISFVYFEYICLPCSSPVRSSPRPNPVQPLSILKIPDSAVSFFTGVVRLARFVPLLHVYPTR
jgi:hypothetical protein